MNEVTVPNNFFFQELLKKNINKNEEIYVRFFFILVSNWLNLLKHITITLFETKNKWGKNMKTILFENKNKCKNC